jgi:cytoplasmic iron level regulating protein YaaA (DUF328/UPF0246 family)
MLTVISPAKTLNFDLPARDMTAPIFAEDTAKLLVTAKRQGIGDLQKLMSISEKLARLNRDRFRDWDDAPERAAVFAFAGDTYTGLDAASLDEDALRWAQDHLRILSGMYGLLRPLDAMKPYRLEMGTRLKTRRGKDLYAFWGDRLAKGLNALADETGAEVLLNCASQEYFGAVDRKALKLRVITPTFLEDRAGGPKQISFFAKQARGAMARFVAENRVTEVAALKGFETGGYAWDAERSTEDAPVFVRPESAQAAA